MRKRRSDTSIEGLSRPFTGQIKFSNVHFFPSMVAGLGKSSTGGKLYETMDGLDQKQERERGKETMQKKKSKEDKKNGKEHQILVWGLI